MTEKCWHHDKEWKDCSECDENGCSHHECGEDTCCCLDKSNNVVCDNCAGETGWWYCHDCKKTIEGKM